MAIIVITDPNDPATTGGLSNPDPVNFEEVLQGAFFNLTVDEYTSSEDVKNLFNLESPPSFHGPYMVWGEYDRANDSLSLWLEPTTGERNHAFAKLEGFKDGAGSGSLFRSNKLPPDINWALSA